MAPQGLIPTDLGHLRRCIELAAEALAAGDAPFGSVLVDNTGGVRNEDRNRTTTADDQTRHPEIDLARWAAAHMTAEERAGATVYTSGEHCPMCSAAHAWVGLGRIVYVASAAQLARWQGEWGVASSGVAPLSIQQVAPGIPVEGPVAELEDDIRALHKQKAGV
ncbi:cytidine deaminase-like protein [Xylariaceae sp. FL0804]|nr:cytidine deaminase-like protein [Xylariaceae sp. FL0804]